MLFLFIASFYTVSPMGSNFQTCSVESAIHSLNRKWRCNKILRLLCHLLELGGQESIGMNAFPFPVIGFFKIPIQSILIFVYGLIESQHGVQTIRTMDKSFYEL